MRTKANGKRSDKDGAVKSFGQRPIFKETRKFSNTRNKTATMSNTGLLQKMATGHTIDDYAVRSFSQTKLSISQPGDKYEQEADRVADRVVRQLNWPQSQCQTAQFSGPLEEKVVNFEKKPNTQQLSIFPQQQPATKNNVAISANLGQGIDRALGNGQALKEQVREPLEWSFGNDFNKVVIHTDAESNRLNQLLHARAFTIGNDIFLRPAEYNIGSEKGLKLLCHELSHVMQQSRLGFGGGIIQLTPEADFRSAFLLVNERQRATRLREIIRSLEVPDLPQARLLAGELADDTQLRTDFRQRLPTLHQDILSALVQRIRELVDQQQTIVSRRRAGVRGPREGVTPLLFSPEFLASLEARQQSSETAHERLTVAPPGAAERAVESREAMERMRQERTAPIAQETARLEAARQAETTVPGAVERARVAHREEIEQMQQERTAPTAQEAARLEAARQAETTVPGAVERARVARREEMEQMQQERTAPAIPIEWRPESREGPSDFEYAVSIIHIILDALGFLPVVGVAADALHTVIYLGEGDWLNAGISAAAIFGDGVTFTRYGLLFTEPAIIRIVREGANPSIRRGRSVIAVASRRGTRPIRVPRRGQAISRQTGIEGIETMSYAPGREVAARRPRGFETGRYPPGRRVKPGRLEGLEPTSFPPSRRPRRRGPSREEQLEGLLMKRASAEARQQFATLRPNYANRLGANVEDVHHAIELQVLDNYPGVFSAEELNRFANMRGIPRELGGSKQLHNNAIRSRWNEYYDQLDTIISQRGLVRGTEEYNQFVRRFVSDARDVIDHDYNAFYTQATRELQHL